MKVYVGDTEGIPATVHYGMGRAQGMKVYVGDTEGIPATVHSSPLGTMHNRMGWAQGMRCICLLVSTLHIGSRTDMHVVLGVRGVPLHSPLSYNYGSTLGVRVPMG